MPQNTTRLTSKGVYSELIKKKKKKKKKKKTSLFGRVVKLVSLNTRSKNLNDLHNLRQLKKKKDFLLVQILMISDFQ